MTDTPSSRSQRAEAQAAAKARRVKRIERREACLDLVASGYSYRQIATRMQISVATVRREVDKALAERPVHAPERHASLQVTRLNKALCRADFILSKGDIRAFTPYMKLVAAIDRYYGVDGRARAASAPHAQSVSAAAPPPLALTHASEPALPPLASEVAGLAAQDVEIARAPVDIALSLDGDEAVDSDRLDAGSDAPRHCDPSAARGSNPEPPPQPYALSIALSPQ